MSVLQLIIGQNQKWENNIIWQIILSHTASMMASCLVRSSPDRVVQVRALAGDTVLYSWARHFTLTVPLEYKWELANCWGSLTNCGEVTCNGLASRPGGVEILLATPCYRNWDKLCQLWTKASLLFSFYTVSLGYSCLHKIKLNIQKHFFQLWSIFVNINKQRLHFSTTLLLTSKSKACVLYTFS